MVTAYYSHKLIYVFILVTNVISKLTRYSTIVGFTIREFRECLSVSQADLAESVDIAQAAWSKVEKGVTTANIQHLEKVGKKLDIPPSSILFRADEVKLKLIGLGWEVLDRKTNNDEVDLLLDGLLFKLKALEIKSLDPSTKIIAIGGIGSSALTLTYALPILPIVGVSLGLAGLATFIGYRALTKGTSEESQEFLKSLESKNLKKTNAKSTKGRIFDIALDGAEQLIQLDRK